MKGRGFSNHNQAVSFTKGVVIWIEALQSDHEEADTRLLLHAAKHDLKSTKQLWYNHVILMWKCCVHPFSVIEIVRNCDFRLVSTIS